MNLGQMILIMLAIILFSTIVLMVNNSLVTQIEMMSRTIYFTQGNYYADSILQQLESDILGHVITITELHDLYVSPLDFDNEITIGDATYSIRLRSRYYNNILGGVSAGDAPTNAVLVTCVVRIVQGPNEWINGNLDGNVSDSAYNKIFTLTGVGGTI